MPDKKYIDAERLKETISQYEFESPFGKMYEDGGNCVLNFYIPKMIDNEPAADVVPVTRCKDCIFFEDAADIENHGRCIHMAHAITPDDYCGYGIMSKDGDTNA